MAKQFEVKVKVKANDIIEAEIIREGIQNVLNELGENQAFLIELANPQVARNYHAKLKTIIDNPIVKKLAGSFGGK